MPTTVQLRDLRNRFPQVRAVLEQEGSVILTERGKPRYRLSIHAEPRPARPGRPDFMARLTRSQPRPLSVADLAALREDNRGDR